MNKDILTKDFPKKRMEKEIGKALALLRRVYNFGEHCHLNDCKMIDRTSINFSKKLLDEIFCYLHSRNQTFRETTEKRQIRFRRKQKLINENMEKENKRKSLHSIFKNYNDFNKRNLEK